MSKEGGNTEVEYSGRATREWARVNYVAAVKITSGDGSIRRGNLRDIGINSLFVKIDGSSKVPLLPSPDSPVDVDIIVNQGDSRLTIGSVGTILRTDQEGVAIAFLEPLKWWPIFSVFPQNDQFLFDMVS